MSFLKSYINKGVLFLKVKFRNAKDKIYNNKFLVYGGIIGILVNLIPLTGFINSLLPVSLLYYLMVFPVSAMPIIIWFIDLRKKGNNLRGLFLGFSIISLTLGFPSYYKLFWLGQWDFRRGENMEAIFRSIYLSGVFAIYERIISYLQNQLN